MYKTFTVNFIGGETIPLIYRRNGVFVKATCLSQSIDENMGLCLLHTNFQDGYGYQLFKRVNRFGMSPKQYSEHIKKMDLPTLIADMCYPECRPIDFEYDQVSVHEKISLGDKLWVECEKDTEAFDVRYGHITPFQDEFRLHFFNHGFDLYDEYYKRIDNADMESSITWYKEQVNAVEHPRRCVITDVLNISSVKCFIIAKILGKSLKIEEVYYAYDATEKDAKRLLDVFYNMKYRL